MKRYLINIQTVDGKTIWCELDAKNYKQALHKARLKYSNQIKHINATCVS